MPVSFPVPEPRIMPRFGLLSTRQEAFCRHFVACGNAAEAARRAGYAERSARQSGHALLERSHIVERVRQIRLLWRQTARAEVQILLARLEQVWEAAVAAEAPQLMLRVVRYPKRRMQAFCTTGSSPRACISKPVASPSRTKGTTGTTYASDIR